MQLTFSSNNSEKSEESVYPGNTNVKERLHEDGVRTSSDNGLAQSLLRRQKALFCASIL